MPNPPEDQEASKSVHIVWTVDESGEPEAIHVLDIVDDDSTTGDRTEGGSAGSGRHVRPDVVEASLPVPAADEVVDAIIEDLAPDPDGTPVYDVGPQRMALAFFRDGRVYGI